jgi:gamma-glutamylcyclotransferase (GGCT)/AIG2-like uncharacterized protein YtfP
MTSARYFAYGGNIIAADMAVRCPEAREIGVATLPGWRFAIMANGYATIVPDAKDEVIGVVWAVTPRCERILDEFEAIDRGLYTRETLTIAGEPTLVYLGAEKTLGKPRVEYLRAIIADATARGFPQTYLEKLSRALA